MDRAMGKKWRIGLVCVGACLLTLSFMATQAQSKTYQWKISQGIAEDHPAAARCKQFADLVGEKSGGKIVLIAS